MKQQRRFFHNRIHDDTLTTLTSMQTLLQTRGIDEVHSIYAETTYNEREQAYVKKYNLTLSKGHPCISRLIGVSCKQGTNCIQVPRDHTTLWNRNGKPFVFITQPYYYRLDSLKELILVCEQYNLDLTISGCSWHYPDNTLFIEIHRRGWDEELKTEERK